MKHLPYPKAALSLVFLIGFLLVVFGCNGENGGVTSPTVTREGGKTTIDGIVYKGPVNGGLVMAYAMNNGTMGEQLGSATTDPQGNFSMMVGGYSGPVMLSMSGGTYMDEATGSMMTMAPSDMMTAVIPSVSSGGAVTGIQMTPLTSMAQSMAGGMSGGMTVANIEAANKAMGDYFMVNDVLHTPPMNPNIPDSGARATRDMQNYGMSIAAMMENAKTLGMTSSSGMVTAMMNDASDGAMNGMMAGGKPIAMGGGMSMMGGGTMMQANMGTAGMADAMTTFMNSSMNKSGLTVADMQALMNHLSSSSGAIQ